MTYQPSQPQFEASRLTAGRLGANVPGGVYARIGKRVLDLGIVLLAAAPVAAVVAMLAVVILFGGHSPIYGHRRIGRGGREFRCWKLRTMVRDAEAQLARHLDENPDAAREWAATQKLARDPRVTRFGRLLRKSSLDELPQLWNVLRGEMSLVGPRPVTAEELARYGTAAVHYMSLRPGITGPWQVDGRNSSSYDDRVALDTAYARSVTFRRDLGILLRTVPAVLKLTGR